MNKFQSFRSSLIKPQEDITSEKDHEPDKVTMFTEGADPLPDNRPVNNAAVFHDVDVKEIPIDKIEINDGGRREIEQDRSFARMKASIDEVGVLQPIGVKKDGERYSLIYGRRRLEMCKRSGNKTILARIYPESLTPLKEHLMRIAENSNRKDFHPLQLASELHAYISAMHPELKLSNMISLFINDVRRAKNPKDHAATVAAVQDISGLSPRSVQNYLSLLKLDDEAKEAMEKGELSPTVAYELVKHLEKQGFKAIQTRVINEKLNKKSVQELFVCNKNEFKEDPDKNNPQEKKYLNVLKNLRVEFNKNQAIISRDGAMKVLAELQELTSIFHTLLNNKEDSGVDDCEQEKRSDEG